MNSVHRYVGRLIVRTAEYIRVCMFGSTCISNICTCTCMQGILPPQDLKLLEDLSDF